MAKFDFSAAPDPSATSRLYKKRRRGGGGGGGGRGGGGGGSHTPSVDFIPYSEPHPSLLHACRALAPP